jgi:hypothetical protein
MQVQRDESRPIHLFVAVAIPLAMLAVAYGLWAISDRLVRIGPFDRAAFGWIVVVPFSWLAPGVAGLAWAPMPASRQRIAAILVGGVVALVSGILLATAIHYASCGRVASWTDHLPASLAIGLVVAAGPVLGALAAAAIARRMTGLGRIPAALAAGATIGVVGLFAAILTFAIFFPAISCAATQ